MKTLTSSFNKSLSNLIVQINSIVISAIEYYEAVTKIKIHYEAHSPTTNTTGLVSAGVGKRSITSRSIRSIFWGMVLTSNKSKSTLWVA